MNGTSRMSLRWAAAAASAVVLLAIGAGGAYVVQRLGTRSTTRTDGQGGLPRTDATAGRPPATTDGALSLPARPLPDVVVTLGAEAIQRARIVIAPVVAGVGVGALRLSAVVEPNAYRQVYVTPLVAGRVIRVLVELGAHVREGQTMAQVFSPDLAEAQTRYLSARAELEAHERELERTTKLVQIGAASRQELERLHAEHTSRKTNVESARSRLELLGLPRSTIDRLSAGTSVEATTDVRAPIAGVVTERLVNVGLNVDPAAKLFTVIDMSSVWVIADLYEKDFSRVRVGDPASISTTAYPDLLLGGRVSYIDPQVNAQTRTAKVRVEVSNPRNELRFGMYAEVRVQTAGRTSGILIPRSAVQNVGDRSVVYLVNPSGPGQFTEREVRLGQQTGDQVEVLSGVAVGDSVAADGSFLVRAERERLGLRPPQVRDQQAAPGVQTARVVLGEQGYDPSKVTFRAGVRARLTFLRTTDKTCGTEVVFPSLNIRRALPLNEPVEIEFTPVKAGDLAFACGMNMLKGVVVVE
jgi:cobalt-zinc-cadmium efflux system membrane fusion protein